MLHEGPLPFFVHCVLEYVLAALLIAAPFLFNFHAGAATAASLVLGVVLLVVAATTTGSRTSLVDSLPLGIHIIFDFGLAAVLIAVPFLFGFSNEGNPTAFFIVLGVVALLIDIGTRYPTHGAVDHQARH